METKKIVWQYPVGKLLEELKLRTSYHLSVSQSGEDPSEDWTDRLVLDEGEQPWVVKMLQEIFPQIYGALSVRLSVADPAEAGETGISLAILFPENVTSSYIQVLYNQVKDVQISYVLSRWYLTQNPELSTYYAAQCDAALSTLRSLLSKVSGVVRRPTNYHL